MKKVSILFLSLFLSLIVYNCDKDYQEDEQFPNGSNFKIVNIAANISTQPLVVYMDENKLIEQNLYNSSSNYYRATNATHTLKFNTSNADSESTVLSINDNFELNNSATYFLYNPDNSSKELIYIKTKDNIARADFQKSKIRLANFVSDLGTGVDIIVGGTLIAGSINGGTVYISNVSYKEITDFVTVPYKATVYVCKTGTTIPLKSLASTNFGSTGVYTLVLGGYSSSTPALSFNSYTNVQ